MLKSLTTVKLYQITDEDIESVANTIPSNIPILKGTMAVHQMSTAGNGILLYREASCFCVKNDLCSCFDKKMYPCYTKQDVNKTRCKTKFSDIYSSTSSELSSDEDIQEIMKISKEVAKISKEVTEKNIKVGTYMLVKFMTNGRRNLTYKYAVVAQSDIEEDGEVKVMTLKAINDARKLFKTVDEDVSYIHFDQILKILPEPEFNMKGGRLYYEFPHAIDVFQKP